MSAVLLPDLDGMVLDNAPSMQLSATELNFDFGNRKPKSCRIVDANRTDAEIVFPSTLPPNSFMLVEFA